MELRFVERGNVQMDDVRIIFRNFSGAPSKYNREGDRNFAIVIPDSEISDALIKEGWNVRIKPPREEGDDPFMYLPVKVKFSEYGPKIFVQSGSAKLRMDESDVHRLDKIDISSVDVEIRPYDWEIDGRVGRTAYLSAIWVYQNVDRFEERFAGSESPEDPERLPF